MNRCSCRCPHRQSAARDGGRYNMLPAILIGLLIVDLGACTTTSHQFAQPTSNWETRTGQLLYRNPKTTVMGDVIVRFSNTGDFQLMFSKGPGLTLLTLRQDEDFAEVQGPMAGRGWSGRIERAPQQLRGWIELREALIRAKDRHRIRHSSGLETFIFRF